MLKIINYFISCREWEKELMRARRKNSKPQLKMALFRMFWRSCIVDGFLVFTFALLKSIMPVFLAQLLLQFQVPIAIDSINSTENNETTTLPTSTVKITAASAIISNTNDDDDDNIWKNIFQYMVFIW